MDNIHIRSNNTENRSVAFTSIQNKAAKKIMAKQEIPRNTSRYYTQHSSLLPDKSVRITCIIMRMCIVQVRMISGEARNDTERDTTTLTTHVSRLLTNSFAICLVFATHMAFSLWIKACRGWWNKCREMLAVSQSNRGISWCRWPASSNILSTSAIFC